MYLQYLEKEISRIENYIDQKTLICYKGFPSLFVSSIVDRSRSELKISNYINLDGKYDSKKILNSKSNLVKDCISTEANTLILPYELLTVISKSIDLDLLQRKLVIINNNLFQEYPRTIDLNILDMEEEIDSIKFVSSSDDDFINVFYSYTSIINNRDYVNYLDLSEDLEFESISFFESKVYTFDKEYVGTTIIYGSDEYELLKWKVFNDEKVEDCSIVVNHDSISEEANKELGALSSILTDNDVELRVLKSNKTVKEEYRPELTSILEEYWESKNFRKIEFYENPKLSRETNEISQGVIVENIIKQSELASKGNNFKDIFLTAPTGSGKSLLFQIPAIYLAQKSELVTIVVSPLIALMEDQVQDLNDRGFYNVTYINSNISYIDRQNKLNAIKEGHISILYLSPELLLSYQIEHFIGDRKLGLFVIDEAHLVTTWGRDFRVDYWFLGNYISKVRKRYEAKFPIAAFTATAAFGGPDDLVYETVQSLNMQTHDLYIGKARRDDIGFDIEQVKYNTYEVERMERTNNQVTEYVTNNTKALVYFPWVKQINETYLGLDNGIREQVKRYSGGMYKIEKSEVLEGFKKGQLKVVLASKAFGMGVDISDIEVVYHHAPSGSLSDYIQEVGRVARKEGIEGLAKVHFAPQDLKYAKILYGLSSIKQWQVNLLLKKLNNIYKNRNSRNFLVSVEDFSHIFDSSDDGSEGKVKSGLVILEQDLNKKYGYPVILVRAKSLFSEVFCKINKSHVSKFESEYSKYIDKRYDIHKEYVVYRNGAKKKIRDERVIFKLQLNRLWEDNYSDVSFPKMKSVFFNGDLFPKYQSNFETVYQLKIILNDHSNKTLKKLENYLWILESAFNELKDVFFNRSEFDKVLNKKITNSKIRKEVVDITLSIFHTPVYKTSTDPGNIISNNLTFLQKRRGDSEETFKVNSNSYTIIRDKIMQESSIMFNDPKSKSFEDFIPFDVSKSKLQHQVAHLIEAFNLGSFELLGGSKPLLFVRINDPKKIDYLSENYYKNEIVEDVQKRHKSSMKIMETFFTEDYSTKDRWDFIEDYFLGENVIMEEF